MFAETQPELPLRDSAAPRITADDVELLCRVLRGRGWVNAPQIADAVLIAGGGGWNDRRVRAVAEAADGAVLSWPGSPGYKFFDEASEAEAARCDAAWGSQIERMTARRTAYRRRHHRRELVR